MKLSLLAVICTFLFITTTNGQNGLNYNYYEGNWNTLPDFHTVSPLKTGNTSGINLNVRNRDTQYGIVWYGSINIPTSGTYTFEMSSDDGSRFYLADYSFKATPFLDADGVHPTSTVTGSTYLAAGTYPVAIAYFQKDGGQVMDVYWSSNTGIARQKIPTSAFNYYSSAPKSTTGGLNYKYYEGAWSAMPDFNALTAVKTGSSANVDISVSNRATNYAISWQGTINVPTEANYTFETVSDDGSKLSIGDGTSTWPVVNNDGLHASQARWGVIYLRPGTYNINISYFQNGGGQTMEVYWTSDHGLARQKIADNIFSGGTVVTPPVVTPPVVTPPVVTPDPPVVTPDPPVVTDPTGSGGLTGKNNYYFSSANGDDSRTSTQAQNPSTPWKSLSKLNSFFSSLKAGDAVLFNRGENFDGSITINNSGTNGNPIILSSYGTGTRPVINGLTTLTNWVSSGNGVWESSCPSADAVGMVTLNDKAMAMGRYPNITDVNKGYLTIDSHVGGSSITDYQLSGNINFTGAEAVIRKNNWVLDRCLITYHSGNTLYVNSPSTHESSNGYGFFIQNSPQTLDQLGEWYFDPSQKKLKMYFGSNNPNSYTVKASVVNQLVGIANRSNILFDNLAFKGADDVTMLIQNDQNITIQNCDFKNSGSRVIDGSNSSYVLITNSTFNYTNNEAILLQNCSNTSVKGNLIKNSGTLPGMGQSGNGGYQALHLGGSYNNIELNEIDSSGYSGLSFSGDNISVKNNYINYFCITKDDGGGIYTWGDLSSYNRSITGNIITNGLGVAEGTFYAVSTGASGIMLDDNSANVDIQNNSISNCSRSGIFIHNSHEVTLKGNTLFDNHYGFNLDHDDISPNNPLRNMSVSNNILFSKKPSQLIMFNQSMTNDFSSWGSFDNNYYTRPLAENGIINLFYKDQSNSEIYKWYDIEGWYTAFGYDRFTSRSAVKIPAYTVNSTIGSNKFKNGDFVSDALGLFCLGNCGTSWNWGKLDGGALQLGSYSFTTANVGAYLDMGAVTAGTQYLVKFTSMGSYSGRTMRALVQKNGGSYDQLSDNQYIDIGPGRTENEFLFTAPLTAPATFLVLVVMEQDCPVWIDNVKIYEVKATDTNPDNYFRFEYNPTTNAKTIGLDATYYDVKNNRYSGNLTLQPFTSVVLIKSPTSLTGGEQTAAAAVTTDAVASETITSKVINLAITPNPASDQVQILLDAPESTEKATLSINSIAGVTLKKINVTSPKQAISVDISSWAKGVYVITLVYDGKVINKKFIKQ